MKDIADLDSCAFTPPHPLRDGDHYMTLTFTATTPGTGMLDITAGKKTKVATASVEIGGTPAEHGQAIEFTAPDWAASKQLAEKTVVTPDTLTLMTK